MIIIVKVNIIKGEDILNMPYKMDLKMVCSDLETTNIIYNILLPELKTFSSHRAKIDFSVERSQRIMKFFIEAADITALRSTTNSILKLIILILDLHKTIQFLPG